MPNYAPPPWPLRASSRTWAGPGQRVAIALPAGLPFVAALHACLLIGAVAVPGDPAARPGRAGHDRGRCGADRGRPCVVTGIRRAPGRTRSDATALIVHTSGTTATPRPVALTYANLLWSALGFRRGPWGGPEERWLCTLPLSHVGGLSILLRSAIYATTAIRPTSALRLSGSSARCARTGSHSSALSRRRWRDCSDGRPSNIRRRCAVP